jgi:Tol biopolymer transport system component
MADPMSAPPSWSADGAKITFASTREEGLEVWIVGVDGAGLTRLTDFGAAATIAENDLEPFEFSVVTMICPEQVDPSGIPAMILPDADPAEFESQGCRRADAGEASYLFEVKAVGEGGAKIPQVVEATSDDQGVTTIRGYLDPDAIMYQLVETAPVYFPLHVDGPPFAATYVVANSGAAPAGEEQIPGEVLEIPGAGMDGPNDEDAAMSPAWSPDGSKIAFFVVGPIVDISGQTTSGGVYLMNPDGSGVEQLTDLIPMPYLPPAWSPDGSKLLFLASSGNAEYGVFLYVMNADGTGLTKLSSEYPQVWTASWSPDGRIIATFAGEGTYGIDTMNADGSGLTDLFTSSTPVPDVAWSPDGTKIAFVTIPESEFSEGE